MKTDCFRKGIIVRDGAVSRGWDVAAMLFWHKKGPASAGLFLRRAIWEGRFYLGL